VKCFQPKLTRNPGPIGLKINHENFSADANQKPRTNRVKVNNEIFSAEANQKHRTNRVKNES
jgi:hypothetical protein